MLNMTSQVVSHRGVKLKYIWCGNISFILFVCWASLGILFFVCLFSGALSYSREVSMTDTPLGQVTGDDDDGDGLMLTKETSNEVKGYFRNE